jgi:hypothetical protein
MAESPFRRQAGWMILKEIYPELAAQLPDYNFRDNDEVCREKASRILPAAAPCAPPNGGPAATLGNSAQRYQGGDRVRIDFEIEVAVVGEDSAAHLQPSFDWKAARARVEVVLARYGASFPKPSGLVNCKVFGPQGPSLTNRMTELVTYGSVGGGGSNPAPYPALDGFPVSICGLRRGWEALPSTPRTARLALCLRLRRLRTCR